VARGNSEVSSENSSASFNSTNYSSLLHAFHETHEEANKLALSNNRLKGLNNWLEARVKELEDEVLQLKTDFDHLEIIYIASSDIDSRSVNCKNRGFIEQGQLLNYYYFEALNGYNKSKCHFGISKMCF